MAAIRSKNTKPELIVRRGLHARGFRFRLHDRTIPGSPDIVLPKRGALIDVRSCFFHGHDCALFKIPAQRRDFWIRKIDTNRARDLGNISLQLELGWRTAIVWECSLRGRNQLGEDLAIDTLSHWLLSDTMFTEVRGT